MKAEDSIMAHAIDQLAQLEWAVGTLAELVANPSPKSFESNLNAIGASLIKRVGGRATYDLGKGISINIFTHEGKINFVEVDLDVTTFESELRYHDELEETDAEYRGKFVAAHRRMQAMLGMPAYHGEPTDEGFPDDQDAFLLTAWQIEGGTLFLQAKNEDSGLPFRITLVYVPSG